MPDNDVPLKAIEEAVESLLPAAAGGDFTMQAVLKACRKVEPDCEIELG